MPYKIWKRWNDTLEWLLRARVERLALQWLRANYPYPFTKYFIQECTSLEGRGYWYLYHRGRIPGTLNIATLAMDYKLAFENTEV